MFTLLGQTLSYQCKLSPAVQYNVWSVFIKPVLRSGLASLPVRPGVLRSLTSFHRRVLRGILKLSKYSPVVPLYFLLGELPIEAALHLDIMSLFWNIWANPQTKVSDILKYILKMAGPSSLTWSAHLRILCLKYSLPDPLVLLQGPAWPKKHWKNHVKTIITAYHESHLREAAMNNHKLSYLNVHCTGLTGRIHPVLSWVCTTQDVEKVRISLKMLAGDYLCSANLSGDRESDPQCLLCKGLSDSIAPAEDMCHLLTICRATADTRTRVLPDLLNTVSRLFLTNEIVSTNSEAVLTQFILDSSSLNLPNNLRIQPGTRNLSTVLSICSNYCFAIHKERIRQLTKLGHIKK